MVHQVRLTASVGIQNYAWYIPENNAVSQLGLASAIPYVVIDIDNCCVVMCHLTLVNTMSKNLIMNLACITLLAQWPVKELTEFYNLYNCIIAIVLFHSIK